MSTNETGLNRAQSKDILFLCNPDISFNLIFDSSQAKELMDILPAAADYAYSLLEGLSPDFIYHNINHTRYVREKCRLIGNKEGLDSNYMAIAEIAALFHDTGYTVSYMYHEMESRKIAGEFLKSRSCSTEMIYKVLDCICATRYPSYPADQVEEVMCDADLAHLASADFLELNEYLRDEWNIILKMNISRKEHLRGTLKFLLSHKYFTKYGQDVLEARKQQNIEKVRTLL